MDLYYGRISGNSCRSVFALEESGGVWQPRLVDTVHGGNKLPDYLAINPMGKIPALIDGDLRLWESNAINFYVAEKNPNAGLLPKTADGRARVLRWQFFQAAHVTPACVPVFRAAHPIVLAHYGKPGDAAAAATGRKELQRWLPVIDAALEGREWLEDAFSLADVAHAPHLWLIRGAGFDLAPWPRLAGWLDRVTARPAWKRAAERVFGPA